MKQDELVQFKRILLAKRGLLASNVNRMEDEALRKNRQNASGDLSSIPIHLADIGTDNYEQEFTLGLIQDEEEVLHDIDEAIARIEDGTYGACEMCEKKIPKARLKVVPHARLCIECQRKEELRPKKG
jgi:DnaK suppressor protein